MHTAQVAELGVATVVFFALGLYWRLVTDAKCTNNNLLPLK